MTFYNVPGDFASIEAALAVVVDGDTITASGPTSEQVYYGPTIAGTITIAFGSGTSDAIKIDWSDAIAPITGSLGAGGFTDGTRTLNLSGVESLTIVGSAANDVLGGSDITDIFDGNDGDDELNVSTGTFSADGGSGIDFLSADLSAETFALSFDLSTVFLTDDIGGGNHIADIERLSLIAGSGNDRIVTLTGAYDDIIETRAGNDEVFVSGGSDSVDMGDNGVAGDALHVDFSGATSEITFYSGGGWHGLSGKGYGIAFKNAEIVYLDTGTGDDQLTLGDWTDVINAGTGTETIDAKGGDDRVILVGDGFDTVEGGAGTDTLVVDYSFATTSVSGKMVSGGGVFDNNGTNDLTFSGFEAIELSLGSDDDDIVAGDRDDILHGNGGSDTLDGGAGADLMDGGLGVDSLTGGAGDDTYYVDDIDDDVIETDAVEATGGHDTVHLSLSSGRYDLGDNLEDLVLDGKSVMTLVGNALVNRITGNVADNVLSGGTDGLVDTLVGGAGNDTYLLEAGSDTVIETLAGGTDTVKTTISRTLGNNLETLVLMGGGKIDGTGNKLANTIRGNANANDIAGLGGKDALTGGGGADHFVYKAASEGGDTISDFSAADFFELDASAFGGLTKAGLASAFIVRAQDNHAQDGNDRLIFRADTDQLWFDANGSKAGGLTLIADLGTNVSLTAADILLF